MLARHSGSFRSRQAAFLSVTVAVLAGACENPASNGDTGRQFSRVLETGYLPNGIDLPDTVRLVKGRLVVPFFTFGTCAQPAGEDIRQSGAAVMITSYDQVIVPYPACFPAISSYRRSATVSVPLGRVALRLRGFGTGKDLITIEKNVFVLPE